MSLTAKLVILGLVLLVLCAGAWKIVHNADKAGYQRAQHEYEARAEMQREANRGRSDRAEQKESARTIVRTRYITRIVKELDHAAQDLAACPMPPAVARLLNDASRCASENRPASCGAGDPVPEAK